MLRMEFRKRHSLMEGEDNELMILILRELDCRNMMAKGEK